MANPLNLDALLRKNAHADAPDGDKPPVIAALDELGATGRAICRAIDVHEPTYSAWKRGYVAIPEDKHAQLVQLLREAHSAVSAASHIGANKIKLARVAGILRALESGGKS